MSEHGLRPRARGDQEGDRNLQAVRRRVLLCCPGHRCANLPLHAFGLKDDVLRKVYADNARALMKRVKRP